MFFQGVKFNIRATMFADNVAYEVITRNSLSFFLPVVIALRVYTIAEFSEPENINKSHGAYSFSLFFLFHQKI
jgi:hypothetical protein